MDLFTYFKFPNMIVIAQFKDDYEMREQPIGI